jgi:hypothetical protein
VAACLCSIAFVAVPANARSAIAAPAVQQLDTVQCGPTAAPSGKGETDDRGCHVAERAVADHLAWQYALHRSSLYLYNPVGTGERVASAADGRTIEQ